MSQTSLQNYPASTHWNSPSLLPGHRCRDCSTPSGQREDHVSPFSWTHSLSLFIVVCVELLAAVQLARPLSWLMARVWDSEVLNCPYVNQPINAEQSHITSALISPVALWRYGAGSGKAYCRGRGMRRSSSQQPEPRSEGKERWNKKRMKKM